MQQFMKAFKLNHPRDILFLLTMVYAPMTTLAFTIVWSDLTSECLRNGKEKINMIEMCRRDQIS